MLYEDSKFDELLLHLDLPFSQAKLKTPNFRIIYEDSSQLMEKVTRLITVTTTIY